MIKKLNHIGIAVRSIDDTMRLYSEAFGAEEIGRKTFEQIGQTSALVKIGDFYIELMEPYGEKGVVPAFLSKHGEGLHHISVITDGLDEEDAHLSSVGINVIGKAPKEVKGERVMFTYPKQTNGVVFEIVDPGKD